MDLFGQVSSGGQLQLRPNSQDFSEQYTIQYLIKKPPPPPPRGYPMRNLRLILGPVR